MDANKFYRSRRILLFAFLTVMFSGGAATQSGGQFVIEQSVITTGGNTNSMGGQFTLAGTIGQAIAGQNAAGAPFSIYAGFWSAAPVAPTAAMVAVGGRVLTAGGRGIRNVFVTLTAGDGTLRTVLTGRFGAFRFAEIEAGQTVILSVRAKRFVFAEPTQAVFAAEDLTEINFVAAKN